MLHDKLTWGELVAYIAICVLHQMVWQLLILGKFDVSFQKSQKMVCFITNLPVLCVVHARIIFGPTEYEVIANGVV